MTQPSDDLHLRAGLPIAFRYLEPDFPRSDWPALRLHPSATHWLEVHGWFRGLLADMVDRGGQWREGGLDAAAYRVTVIPRLRQFLNNLHGHHTIESEHYFPALAALEPGMAKGFDLLDRDHDAIEHLLSDMAQAGMSLNRVAADGGDLVPHTVDLDRAIVCAAGLIGRHLTDEEEIVVPVLTLRGDPLRG